MSGLMSVTGAPDGPPMQVGEPIGDMAAGIYAAFGIVTALLACERHGVGRRLDVALTDSLVSLMMMAVAQHCYGGVRPRRVGNRHPISTPFGSFRAADGDIIIAVASNALFSRLAAALGRPELARDPRFGDDASRTRHEPELRAEIEAWTGARPVAEAVRVLTDAGVPASPIAELPEVVASTYVAARELFHRLVHPVMGPITLIEQPVHFAGLPRGRIGLPPALGADTEAVLRDIAGLDAQRAGRGSARRPEAGVRSAAWISTSRRTRSKFATPCAASRAIGWRRRQRGCDESGRVLPRALRGPRRARRDGPQSAGEPWRRRSVRLGAGAGGRRAHLCLCRNRFDRHRALSGD